MGYQSLTTEKKGKGIPVKYRLYNNKRNRPNFIESARPEQEKIYMLIEY